MQIHKPGSVSAAKNSNLIYHLSRGGIASVLHQPTHPEYTEVMKRAASCSGPIWSFNSWGLPRCIFLCKAVSSYLTFSPLPVLLLAVSFLWHFLSHFTMRLPV